MKNVNSYISGAAEAASRRMAAIVVAAVVACVTVWGCTSALVGASRGADGRWLLWKHRDSGHPDNYVRAFQATDSTMAYVGLFNAADTAAREVWIGFNEAGFAVMNTASYNIPAPAKNWQDREGLMMTEALRHCRSLSDFHRLLLDHPGPRGVQANSGESTRRVAEHISRLPTGRWRYSRSTRCRRRFSGWRCATIRMVA